MNKDFYSVFCEAKDILCSECEMSNSDCKVCRCNAFLQSISSLDKSYGAVAPVAAEGCHVCTDKRGSLKEVFYDTGRGGLGIADFCPNCGRKLNNSL